MNKFHTLLLLAVMSLTPAAIQAADSGESPGPQSRAVTVQEAVSLAMARSPDVLLAQAQVIRSRETLRESRSRYHPQVFVGTGLAVNNGYPLSMEGAAPSIFQVTAKQPFWSKKSSSLIRESEASGNASQFASENVRNLIASETALIYYRLHQSRKIAELANARLDAARKQQEQVDTLVSAGRELPVDGTLARTAVLGAEQQVLVAEEQAKLADTELRELTGITGPIQTVEPNIENSVFGLSGETLYQQALECSPEIRQSEANVRAKEFHVKAEEGEKWPQAEIIGQYALFGRQNNYEDYFNQFSRNNFVLGLSLKVPIFSGSRISSRVAQSRQGVSEERYRLESLKSDLKMSIERGLSALRIARGASEFARSDARAAREILEMNEVLREAGRISPKEMEDFRSQLQQKELALLEADQVLFQRKLELLRALGTISTALQ